MYLTCVKIDQIIILAHVCQCHHMHKTHYICIFIKPQLMAERQQVTREREQLQQELQAANTRCDESQEQVQQLQQRVSDIILTLSNGYSCVIVLIPSAVSHDDK